MNSILSAWNKADEEAALDAMLAAGARRWAAAMVLFAHSNIIDLSAAADRVWSTMEEADWMEAFAGHPRIGERKAAHASKKSTTCPTGTVIARSAAAGVLKDLAAVICSMSNDSDSLTLFARRKER